MQHFLLNSCSRLFQRLIVAVSPLEEKLSDMANHGPMGWRNIRVALCSHQRLAMEQESKDVPWTSYIPKVDDFTISKFLGKGAFGVVYLAVSNSVFASPVVEMCGRVLV